MSDKHFLSEPPPPARTEQCPHCKIIYVVDPKVAHFCTANPCW